jgi:hypothetical protein
VLLAEAKAILHNTETAVQHARGGFPRTARAALDRAGEHVQTFLKLAHAQANVLAKASAEGASRDRRGGERRQGERRNDGAEGTPRG